VSFVRVTVSNFRYFFLLFSVADVDDRISPTRLLPSAELFDSAFNIPFRQPHTVIGGHISDTCLSPSSCGEANLDTQYIMGMAQNVPTTFWYTRDTSSASFTNWIVDVCDKPDPPMVMSISYFISEHFLSKYEVLIFDIEAKKLGLQGVTLLAASGDAGVSGDGADSSFCGYNPLFPASSPYVTVRAPT
jgi:subtilase family serine protease